MLTDTHTYRSIALPRFPTGGRVKIKYDAIDRVCKLINTE